ncbi:non-homologous end-joining DNA ligase [Marinobacter orientalis]|uniref:DNA ligase (ATP) n=1 Tax=Marinobacter orientalis TaxID=1928859 RepID=A0A7Y0WSG5_9GAMM|nr:non-homologous end-joining DNA ligase [Marinobacter orientalis]NMT63879.1 ATP-dependent DNA ligase [Marinobacter orientalis]TGX49979.1 ATP-dependent DNA ligase [Marinobacter orientalis]
MAGPTDKFSAEEKQKLKAQRQPAFVEPMKARLTENYFDDEAWLYERKLDGVRFIAGKKSGKVTLYSRNRKLRNKTYPEIVEGLENLEGDFLVDGEIVAFSGNRSSFSRLQQRMQVRDPDRELLRSVPVCAYLFDILFVDGYDLRKLPLRRRKAILKSAFEFADPIRYLPHRNREGKAYLAQACDKGWEGIIAKDGASVYRSARSGDWLKFKCQQGQEFVIGGFTRPQGSRVGFGALEVGYYEGDKLRYAGRVGTGFSDEFLESFYRRLVQIKRKTSPFDDVSSADEDVTWVDPRLVAEIGFTEWTDDGKLRHPRFLGLRDDKEAKDVVREAP